jgi:inositol phosphorylceramide mannosyltransferase catalytic subunit
MIKFIFQTWKNTEVPEKWKKAQETVINMNKGYEYKLFTDEDNRNFVKDYFPFFLETYDKFEYNIQRADAVRYCILYIHGGIYLDLDYQCNKSFDEVETLLTKPIGLVRSINTPNVTTNSIMISTVKKHPMWLECIRNMMKKTPFFIRGKHLKVMTSTGPIMLNRVRKQKKFTNDIQLLNIVQNCNVCNISDCKPDPNFILTPVEGSSWLENDSKLFIWLFCNKKMLTKLFVIIIILIIGYYIYKKKLIKY